MERTTKTHATRIERLNFDGYQKTSTTPVWVGEARRRERAPSAGEAAPGFARPAQGNGHAHLSRTPAGCEGGSVVAGEERPGARGGRVVVRETQDALPRAGQEEHRPPRGDRSPQLGLEQVVGVPRVGAILGEAVGGVGGEEPRPAARGASGRAHDG